MPEPRIDGSVILTRSGQYVNPLDLKVEDVYVDDIIHALCNQCRYSGHTIEFYSVGEHVVRCVRWLRKVGAPLEVQQCALMHDATETWLIDLPRPLKVDPYFGKAYRGAEDRAMAIVAEAFGLPKKMHMDGAVKTADLVLLATERRDLMPPNGEWVVLDGVEPLPEKIVPWSPKKARAEFTKEYNRLFIEETE